MDSELKDKERRLESLKVSKEIEEEKAQIAQKKALEAEAKAKYGANWRKVLGLVRSLRPNEEVISDLYSSGLGDLRDLSDPRKGFGKRRS